MLLMASVMLSCRSLPGMARISEKWSGPSKVAARRWASWCASEMGVRLTRCSSFSEYGAHLYHTHTHTHTHSLTHCDTHTHTHTHTHSLILLYGFVSCSARHHHPPPPHTHTHSLSHTPCSYQRVEGSCWRHEHLQHGFSVFENELPLQVSFKDALRHVFNL